MAYFTVDGLSIVCVAAGPRSVYLPKTGHTAFICWVTSLSYVSLVDVFPPDAVCIRTLRNTSYLQVVSLSELWSPPPPPTHCDKLWHKSWIPSTSEITFFDIESEEVCHDDILFDPKFSIWKQDDVIFCTKLSL
jgi:hypothetical protein